MFSEDEAKAKRCCGAVGCGQQQWGVDDNQPLIRMCIASACMAWRWDILPMVGAPDQDIAAKRGHCGLAGPGSDGFTA